MIGAATALLLAGNEATIEVSDHLEMRPRANQNVAGPDVPAGTTGLDLLMTPRFYFEIASPKSVIWQRVLPGVGAGAHRWVYSITYTPSFMLEDSLNPDRTTLIYNSAIAAAEWRGRTSHFVLKEEGAYGTQSTAYIGLTAPGAGMPSQQPTLVPTLSTLTSALSRSTAIAEYRFSTRLVGSLLGEYLVSGGANPASQEIVPLQYGPRAELSFNYGQSRRSFWITTLDAQRIDVASALCPYLVQEAQPIPSCAPQSEFALAKETWRFFVSRHSFTELGGGGSVLEGRIRNDGAISQAGVLEPVDPDQPYKLTAYPTAFFTYSYGSPFVIRYPGYSGIGQSVRVDLSLAPFVDYRGVAQNLAGGSVTYGYVHNHFTVSEQVAGGAATGSLFIPAERTVSSRTQVVYTINRHVAVDSTLVYSWVDQAPYGPLSAGYVSFGLTVGTGLVRF